MNVETHTKAQLLTNYENLFARYNEARRLLGHEHERTIKLSAQVLDAKSKLDAHSARQNQSQTQLALI